NRCFNMGLGCWNDKEKNLISEELVNTLIKEKLIPEEKRALAYQKIRQSKIKELVEFSRAIHAEMHAIISGCLNAAGKVQGGMLFITTYPCHNCARHIIVAGIKKVYYIEPYRKSLTTKLHADAITENENDKEKVTILMYDGIAPSRYLQLFKMYNHKRKDGTGEAIEPDLKTAKPKTTLSLEAIPVLELTVSKQLEKKGLKIK
ncbi:MAG TPA: deaminase, partial [Puia sp.]|nr:deaminase [Puia sp.]